MESKESCVFYADWIDHLEKLPPDEAMNVLRAIRAYMRSQPEPQLVPGPDMAFSFIRAQLDRDNEKYLKRCQRNRENGASGGRPPKPKETEKTQSVISEPEKPHTDPDYDNDHDYSSPNGEDNTRPQKAPKKSFGAYGWVKLTDEQFQRLINDLGQAEAERCIAYIDESAQASGNKNHWRDWNVVVRKCSRNGWGRDAQGGKPTYQGKTPACCTDELPELERKALERLKQEIAKGGSDDG